MTTVTSRARPARAACASPKEQRQRAGPGAVRHYQADPLAVQVRATQLSEDEVMHLISPQLSPHPADDRRASSVLDGAGV